MFTQGSNSNDIMANDLSEAIEITGLQNNMEEYYVRLAWQKNSRPKKIGRLVKLRHLRVFQQRLEKYGME